MSNTNYKLICKYAGDLPLTVGKEYPYTISGKYYIVSNDNGYTGFDAEDIGNGFTLSKYFDLVPVDAEPDPIMVQPAGYIDPKLLEAYNALDENGKAIMREKMPDVKWPKVVRYITHGEYNEYMASVFGVYSQPPKKTLVFNFPHDKYTPEINGGEIRFRVKE